MKAWHWRLVGIVVFIAALIAIHQSPLAHYFTIEQLKADRDWLQAFVHQHAIGAMFAYVGLYILAASFALPITAALTIFGGFLFGAVRGTVLTNIGATFGAIASFLVARYLLGTMLQEKYATQLANFNKNIEQYGAYYLLSLRFLVIVPFFLVNLLAGLTNVRLLTFALTTSIGIIPGSLIYSIAGRELATIESLRDIFSWELILAFVGLALLALLPLILQRMGILERK